MGYPASPATTLGVNFLFNNAPPVLVESIFEADFITAVGRFAT